MNKTKLVELKKWMETQQVDCAYLSDTTHIAYFTGYASDPHERVLALFIPLEAEAFLFTPALEVEDAQNSSWSGDVFGYLDSENPWEKIAEILKKRLPVSAKNFAVEKGHLVVERMEEMRSAFPNMEFSKDLTPLVQRLQLIKTEDEIKKLYEAGTWADVAFETGFKAVHEGASEQEVIAEIEYELKKRGVSQMSFDTMVLTGKNAASPHGEPGLSKIQKHELVLFDLGVVWNGYNSDATRTISFHQPTEFDEKIYQIVLEAQLAAQDFVKPGVTAEEIDKVARDVITGYGYGEYFNHRLGHGIGTTVHEFPSLVEGNDLVIEEGMCFSIEPGIYIPEKVGVRIEDCVHVTKNGCLPFTNTTKELQVII
ncbi:Xaa-Pro dipeptidase [Pilibacter termitis]|uniref:Xaa-Pro dipeptidase n=1 Tax=Pilibacter termitis TaxID=263852 RepID=A0A1T4M5G3_9ENTE|nr:Xaa-Pro peptidase family protein [Pilibacter termitis]SJZ62151.1 Xaa-Pro dipeptidase [Pilibacter termitis]